MGSQDPESPVSTAVKHGHGWAPTSTIYSLSAVPILSRSPTICTKSTTSARPDSSAAARLEQEQRASVDAKRRQLKKDRDRQWMEQRNRRRAGDSRAVGSAIEDFGEAVEEMDSVKPKDSELMTSVPTVREGSPTMQADLDESRSSATDLLTQILTRCRNLALPSSLEPGPLVEPAPTEPRMSAYSVMRSDPRTHNGCYEHDANFW
jgi:hypothetical protein